MKQNFFKKLSMREYTLTTNHSLASLLNTAMHDSFTDIPISPLQKHYLITELGYAYQHFGFAILGIDARKFLSEHLSYTSGIANNTLQNWLECVTFMMLEDFNILKIVTGEPDWEMVDATFFNDFARRILCAEPNDNSDFGLNLWDERFIGNLINNASKWVEQTQQLKTTSTIIPDIIKSLDGNPFTIQITKSLIDNLELISKNYLQILFWRIEFVTSFADLRQEAKFIVRNKIETAKATKIAALLAMFLPHENVEGNLFLPTSPLTSSQIINILRQHSEEFNIDLFKNWLDISKDNLDNTIKQLVSEAYQSKLLFEIPQGKCKKAYGLTLNAIKILQPFHATITQALLHENNLVLSQVS